MFITDKLTEFAIAICNEFVALGLGLPPPFDVASSEALKCCFILLFLHFFRFLLCFFFVFPPWQRLDRVDLHYKCTCVDRQLCAKITTVPRRICRMYEEATSAEESVPLLALLLFFFLLYLHLISRIISMAKCTRDGQRVKLHSKTSGRRYTDSDTEYSYRCRYRYIYTACCRYTFVLAETARAVLCAFLCFVHS